MMPAAVHPSSPPDRPREIDPAATFENLVSWVAKATAQQKTPGLIVGLSGTDSILTFLACTEAFNRAGRQHRVLGLHFQHSASENRPDEIICAGSEHDWIATQIIPWLKIRAPQAQIEIDASIPFSNESKRWGHLMARSVSETPAGRDLGSSHYFPVGTRNATEDALGAYSQISKSVSMLPLVQVFKTEVLKICEYLSVPQIAIDKSKEIDCDCGRFDIQADHMRELDLLIMQRQGLLSTKGLRENVPMTVLKKIVEFYQRETAFNEFRKTTPYKPEQSLVVGR